MGATTTTTSTTLTTVITTVDATTAAATITSTGTSESTTTACRSGLLGWGLFGNDCTTTPDESTTTTTQPESTTTSCRKGLLGWGMGEASVILPPQLQQPLLTPRPHVEVTSLVGVFLVGVTLKQQPQQLHQQPQRRQQQLQLQPQLQLQNAVASSAEVSWAVKKQDQSFVSIIRFH